MHDKKRNAKMLSKIHANAHLTIIESLPLKLLIIRGCKVSFYILFLTAQVQNAIFSPDFPIFYPALDLLFHFYDNSEH